MRRREIETRAIRSAVGLLFAAALSSAAPLTLAQDRGRPAPATEGPGAPSGERSGDAQPPSSEAAKDDAQPSFGPDTIRATREAAKRYERIAGQGGWPRIAKPLKPGAKGKDVVALRRRLAIEGDLSENEAQSPDWDDRLTEAVKHFQQRVGLPQTGAAAGATVHALNVPAKTRARQLADTARRLERLRFRFGPRYVFVNIPAAAVELVEDGRKAHGYTAIVGGRKHESPEVVARIVSIDLNPTWTVPSSIIEKELVPKMRRNPDFLAHDDFRVFDSRGREVDPRKVRWSKGRAAQFTFKQDPGAKNSLGSIRLSMPNRHAVYLHDTPKKQLFDRNYRFLSHGCVRVEGVYDLAARLLTADGSQRLDEGELAQKIERGETDKIRLGRPVPVVWAYMTGWATPDGVTHFRRDVYGKDGGKDAAGGRRSTRAS